MIEGMTDQSANGMSIEKFFMGDVFDDDAIRKRKCKVVPAYIFLSVNGHNNGKNKENKGLSSISRTRRKLRAQTKISSNESNKHVLSDKSNDMNIKMHAQLQSLMNLSFKSRRDNDKNIASFDDGKLYNTHTPAVTRKRKRIIDNEAENAKLQPSKRRSLENKENDVKNQKRNDNEADEGKNKKVKSNRNNKASPRNSRGNLQERKLDEGCKKRGRKPKALSEDRQKSVIDKSQCKVLRNVDENCNLSSMLRPRLKDAYKCKSYQSDIDDDDDESWHIDLENKNKRKVKRDGQKRVQKPAKERKNAEDVKSDNKNQLRGKERKTTKSDKDKDDMKSDVKSQLKGKEKKTTKSYKDKDDVKSDVKNQLKGKRKRTTKSVTGKEIQQGKKTGRGQQQKDQEKEEVKKAEECVVTAKKGTLKYLKQREEYVKALTKEVECEDDFLADNTFNKQTKLGKLLAIDPRTNLTIKTPNGKMSTIDDDPLTPRTNFLGRWGVTKECPLAYTPPARSPASDTCDKEGIIETIFHHMKDQKKCARVRKSKKNKGYESVLKSPKKTDDLKLPELPPDPDLDKDDSSSDDYFDESDCF